jgi:hypothetical protein
LLGRLDFLNNTIKKADIFSINLHSPIYLIKNNSFSNINNSNGSFLSVDHGPEASFLENYDFISRIEKNSFNSISFDNYGSIINLEIMDGKIKYSDLIFNYNKNTNFISNSKNEHDFTSTPLYLELKFENFFLQNGNILSSNITEEMFIGDIDIKLTILIKDAFNNTLKYLPVSDTENSQVFGYIQEYFCMNGSLANTKQYISQFKSEFYFDKIPLIMSESMLTQKDYGKPVENKCFKFKTNSNYILRALNYNNKYVEKDSIIYICD